MCQGLGGDIDPYLQSSQPPMLTLLYHCMKVSLEENTIIFKPDFKFLSPKDSNAEARQSAYALLGDLAISSFGFIKPHLATILPEVIVQIHPNCERYLSSVCNNAVWASGEIALKCGKLKCRNV